MRMADAVNECECCLNQLFGGKLGNPAPRFNYDTLLWSFVTTFQVLTGENWNEVMYLCIRHVGWPAVTYFVSEVIIGTYVVLNLFLAASPSILPYVLLSREILPSLTETT